MFLQLFLFLSQSENYITIRMNCIIILEERMSSFECPEKGNKIQ